MLFNSNRLLTSISTQELRRRRDASGISLLGLATVSMSDPTSLKEYLKKYGIDDDKDEKRKKKRKAKSDAVGVTVVDNDPIWQKPVEEEEDSDDDDDKPRAKVRPPWNFTYNNAKSVNLSSDISPPRKRRPQNDTPSPEPYQQSNFPACCDLSPPDQSRKVSGLTPPPRNKPMESPISHRPKFGLVTLEDFKDEIDRKRDEDWLRFKQMAPFVSGKDAEPTYRDKSTGERISKEEFLNSLKKKLKKEEKPKEKKLEWVKGLAQKRKAEARLQEMEAEKEKPFARSRDDTDLNAMLKERERWGDPMAHLIKKKHLGPVLEDLGNSEKMKESGFVIPQEIPNQSWIRRGLDAAPNRYGIKPGRHWDGADRSNGYEKELLIVCKDK